MILSMQQWQHAGGPAPPINLIKLKGGVGLLAGCCTCGGGSSLCGCCYSL